MTFSKSAENHEGRRTKASTRTCRRDTTPEYTSESYGRLCLRYTKTLHSYYHVRFSVQLFIGFTTYLTSKAIVSCLERQHRLVDMLTPYTMTAQRLSNSYMLNTHLPPPRAHTLPPSFDCQPSNTPIISSSTTPIVTSKPVKRNWISIIMGYAPVIGLVMTFVGIVIAIITIVVK